MHFHRIGWKKKIQPEISQVSKRFFFGLAFALFESWAHLEVVISNRDQCCGQILLDYHWVASAYFSRQAHYFQHFVSSYSDVQSQLAFRLLLLLRKLKLMLQEEFDHKIRCTLNAPECKISWTFIKGALASKFVFGAAIGWMTLPFLTGALFSKSPLAMPLVLFCASVMNILIMATLEYRMKGLQNNPTTEEDAKLCETE